MIRTRSAGSVLAAAIVTGGTFAACQSSAQRNQQTLPADLVLRGGRIVTLDDKAPEAQALAARDGRIVAIGSNADTFTAWTAAQSLCSSARISMVWR